MRVVVTTKCKYCAELTTCELGAFDLECAFWLLTYLIDQHLTVYVIVLKLQLIEKAGDSLDSKAKAEILAWHGTFLHLKQVYHTHNQSKYVYVIQSY